MLEKVGNREEIRPSRKILFKHLSAENFHPLGLFEKGTMTIDSIRTTFRCFFFLSPNEVFKMAKNFTSTSSLDIREVFEKFFQITTLRVVNFCYRVSC